MNEQVTEKKFRREMGKYNKVSRYCVLGQSQSTVRYFAELSRDTLKPVGYTQEEKTPSGTKVRFFLPKFEV